MQLHVHGTCIRTHTGHTGTVRGGKLLKYMHLYAFSVQEPVFLMDSSLQEDSDQYVPGFWPSFIVNFGTEASTTQIYVHDICLITHLCIHEIILI